MNEYAELAKLALIIYFSLAQQGNLTDEERDKLFVETLAEFNSKHPDTLKKV